jgi:hypothetical protein
VPATASPPFLCAAALAALTNGTVFDNSMGTFHAAEEVESWARTWEQQMLPQFNEEIANDSQGDA